MTENKPINVAIVDYNLGNLFNVKRTCDHVGMKAIITSSHHEILQSDAVILPGVGAFGDAMKSLEKLDLISPLREFAASNKPLIGICLGMQLFMTESHEFGSHKGLNLIEGRTVGFRDTFDSLKVPRSIKVPQIGWNRIYSRDNAQLSNKDRHSKPKAWSGSFLNGISEGEYMYFVHSFYVIPENPKLALSTSRYSNVGFCSSIKCKNISAFQFHPERSGAQGLLVYKSMVDAFKERKENNNA